jgi:hypothetical protein
MRIKQVLRDLLLKMGEPSPCYRLKWTPVQGGVQPGFDLTGRD